MRGTTLMVAAALWTLVACQEGTSPAAPDAGGSVVGSSTVGQVAVGNNFFRSVRNGSQNPAVDTIAVGGTVTWSWIAAGSHSIQSTGTPGIFRSSIVLVGPEYTYTVKFNTPGTYTYQSALDGAVMSGRIVVR
jgi:plastocyanin